MNTSTIGIEIPKAEDVKITKDSLSVELSDGRTIAVPLEWFPRLVYASQSERKNWKFIGKGHGIHWKELDEDISVEGLLNGKSSGESQSYFKKWLDARNPSRPARKRMRPS